MDDDFDAKSTLAKVQEARKVRRKRSTWMKSKINKYRAELIKLRVEGASLADLQFWLRKEKRIKINRSSIMRFLDKDKSTQDID